MLEEVLRGDFTCTAAASAAASPAGEFLLLNDHFFDGVAARLQVQRQPAGAAPPPSGLRVHSMVVARCGGEFVDVAYYCRPPAYYLRLTTYSPPACCLLHPKVFGLFREDYEHCLRNKWAPPPDGLADRAYSDYQDALTPDAAESAYAKANRLHKAAFVTLGVTGVLWSWNLVETRRAADRHRQAIRQFIEQ